MKRRNALAVLASSFSLFFGTQVPQFMSDRTIASLRWKKKDTDLPLAIETFDYSKPAVMQINLHNLEAIEVRYNGEVKFISPKELFDSI